MTSLNLWSLVQLMQEILKHTCILKKRSFLYFIPDPRHVYVLPSHNFCCEGNNSSTSFRLGQRQGPSCLLFKQQICNRHHAPSFVAMGYLARMMFILFFCRASYHAPSTKPFYQSVPCDHWNTDNVGRRRYILPIYARSLAR